MAERATRSHLYAHVLTYNVTAAQVTNIGRFVIFGATDDLVLEGGGDTVDNVIGVAMTDVASGDTDRRCDVMHPGPVIACKAGGAVTRGAKQKTTSAGKVTDVAAAAASGGNVRSTYGFAVQSGVDGDLLGVCMAFGNRGIA